MKPHEIVFHLRQLDIFQELENEELVELSLLVKEVSYKPQSVIAENNQYETDFYMIVEGEVKLIHGEAVLNKLGPRQSFGEVSLFQGEVRKTTAITDSGAQLLTLSRRDLLNLMESEPAIAIHLCQSLSKRVRELNRRVDELVSPSKKHTFKTVEMTKPDLSDCDERTEN